MTVCKHPIPEADSRFVDFDNIWLHSDIQPLQDSIERFADFPIATKFEQKLNKYRDLLKGRF